MNTERNRKNILPGPIGWKIYQDFRKIRKGNGDQKDRIEQGNGPDANKEGKLDGIELDLLEFQAGSATYRSTTSGEEDNTPILEKSYRH